MDVDGVLTDGKMFYGNASALGPIPRSVEGVFFNVHDGTGITWLHRAGFETAVMTGRSGEAVRGRAKVLGIRHVLVGAKVKIEVYERLKKKTGLPDEAICYIGDDLPDIPVMRRVGLAVTVPNARPEVRRCADLVTRTRGGEGAVRELAEFILKGTGKWEEITGRFFS